MALQTAFAPWHLWATRKLSTLFRPRLFWILCIVVISTSVISNCIEMYIRKKASSQWSLKNFQPLFCSIRVAISVVLKQLRSLTISFRILLERELRRSEIPLQNFLHFLHFLVAACSLIAYTGTSLQTLSCYDRNRIMIYGNGFNFKRD